MFGTMDCIGMSDAPAEKPCDLEDRTLLFAKRVRELVKSLPLSAGNREDGKQMLRSSGSVGASYIEANESLGKKDFLMHVKISRKEAKETRYWLKLIDAGDNGKLEAQRRDRVQEATELMNIFGAIIRKSE